MQVLKIQAGELPRLAEIENDLKTMQDYVGGYIEPVRLGKRLLLICNEEGKLRHLPESATLTARGSLLPVDIVHGNCFVCRVKGGEKNENGGSGMTERIFDAMLAQLPIVASWTLVC